MAEPTGFDVTEWAKVVLPSALAGVGSAFAWLRGAKAGMDARMGMIERVQASQATEIAVLRNEQKNSVSWLEDIQATSRDTNKRIEEMQKTLTQVLLQVRKP